MENSQTKGTKYFQNKLMCGVAGGIVKVCVAVNCLDTVGVCG